ncbi:unnamed protein product [Durusdinium trenchii]|uniref:D-lactate dehydrogenase n=2 Tax=Durusdinium trenchii TaxID=1381693 RepID=A0ABP0M8G3_9DINO
MASSILTECRRIDAAGSGALPKHDLLNVLESALPDWREDDVETLLHTWGEHIQYEAFVRWLFEMRSSSSRSKSRSFKVAIFSCAPYDREWFDRANEELSSNMEFTYNPEQLNMDTVKLAQGCDAVCTFVNDFAGADVVEALHELGVQMIALRCAGFDRVDLKATERFGITVARVPAYSPYAVGEHAVALMLSLNRHITRSYRNARIGNFSLNGAMIGQTLHGKRVGIIGTGLIGSITARVMKKGFECDVVAYDVFENPKIADPEPQGLAIPYVSLDDLLSTCDFISLHAPLLPSTKHMINFDKLKIMKKGIMIVNTSRGGLIDTKALIQGLKDGTIGGAAMDVVENEAPYFFRNFSTSWITDENIAVLLRMPNVILTPHLAFFTREALRTISDTSLKSLAGVRDGCGPPKQNGKLDCVCLPPKEAPSVLRKSTQAAAMTFMQSLPAPVHPMKAEYFPAFENSEQSFRIVFFSATPTEIEAFQKGNEEFNGNFTMKFYQSRLTIESVHLAKDAEGVCIFVHDDASAEVVKALKAQGVKMLGLRCSGTNHVDIAAANDAGLTVTHVPGYSASSIAEHAVALTTSVIRCIPQATENTRRCNFELNGLLGFDMIGKKVGIFGTGRTGKVAARIFSAGYGCEVMCNDPVEKPQVKDMPPSGLGLPYVSEDQIFSECDIICLFVPLNQNTAKMIDAAAIEKMKNGVILVNTSRGGLVDNKALIQGLHQGKIGGAGLDVVEGEEGYFFADWSDQVVQHDDLSILTCFNNVVITYHQAWFTVESMKSLCHTTLRSFHACRLGEEPPLQRNKYKTVVSKQDGDCTASIDFMSFRRSKKEIESA